MFIYLLIISRSDYIDTNTTSKKLFGFQRSCTTGTKLTLKWIETDLLVVTTVLKYTVYTDHSIQYILRGIRGPGPAKFRNLGPDQDQKNFSNQGPAWTRTEKIQEISDRLGPGINRTNPDRDH